MRYRITGADVDLELTPEEIEQLIEALERYETIDGSTDLLDAFREFRKKEFA
jgi:hypothetical protein